MKRFYKEVTVAAVNEGAAPGHWRVELDGRAIRTAGGKPQTVPTRAMAEALAAEWAAQGEQIDARSLPLRDLTDFAIDAVASDREATVEGILPYADTDTLCYRADPDEALYKRQIAVWDPVLESLEGRLDVRFSRVSGIVHRPHPAKTLERLRAELSAQDIYRLAALKMLSSLAASLVIALEAIRPDADAENLWRAANLEEDWQVELWGEDAEATANRTARFEAFKLAMRMAALADTSREV